MCCERWGCIDIGGVGASFGSDEGGEARSATLVDAEKVGRLCRPWRVWCGAVRRTRMSRVTAQSWDQRERGVSSLWP